MFHHDDFFNYIVDCILQQKRINDNNVINISNNNNTLIKSIINNTSSSKFINQFYKETQINIDDILKYEYQSHIYEYSNNI
jgi:hypothetical protein